MEKISTVAVMVLAISSFALSQNRNANTRGPVNEEQALMQLEREIANAYVQGDAKTLERIFANELTSTSDYGLVSTKQDVLLNLRPMVGVNTDVSGLKARIYDKAAVVTGIVVFKAMNEQADYLRITDTFVKRQKGWQLIASQQRHVPEWNARGLGELKPLVVQDCSQESSVKSLSFEVRTGIQFTNTTSQTVVVYWLNYQGERDPTEGQQMTLKAGQSGFRQTFLTHPFLVADASGKCLGIYQPTPEPALAVIR
jgi:Domain of unknown function (DUF4440)